jgi:type IV pilus assembly protein PilA
VYCNNCGAVNEDKANFCVNCGGRMMAATVVVNPAAVMAAPTAAATPPAQVTPAANVPPAQMPPAVLPTVAPEWTGAPGQQLPQTSGKAVAALILGLANGLFLFFFFPLGILAIVFGHISRAEISKSAGRLKGSGMALTGLILGYGSVAIVPVMIIAAIAIPNLLSARMSANESAAVGAIRTINTAVISYQAGAPEKGYPPSLEAMQAAGLIDSSLASGEKSGYRFSYTPVDENSDGVVEGYLLNADPLTPGTTGRKHFFSDETGVIRSDSAQMASKESPPIQ